MLSDRESIIDPQIYSYATLVDNTYTMHMRYDRYYIWRQMAKEIGLSISDLAKKARSYLNFLFYISLSVIQSGL